MEHIELDVSCPPVLVATFKAGMTDAEYRAYLERLTTYVRGVDRYISLNVVHRDTRMTTEQRRLQTEWLKTNHDLMAARSMGTAFVFPSPIFRFVFSMILAVQRFPVAYHIASTREDALEWVARRLRSQGYQPERLALFRKPR